MGCFIPYRRQGWEDWSSAIKVNPLTCDVFGDGSCIGYWPLDDMGDGTLDQDDVCGRFPFYSGNPYVKSATYTSPTGTAYFETGFETGPNAHAKYINASGFDMIPLPITYTCWIYGDVLNQPGYPLEFAFFSCYTDWDSHEWQVELSLTKDTFVADVYATLVDDSSVFRHLYTNISDRSIWHFVAFSISSDTVYSYAFDVDGNLLGAESDIFGLDIRFPYLNERVKRQFVMLLGAGGYEGYAGIDNIRLFSRLLTVDELAELCVKDRQSVGGGGGR